MHSLRVQAGGRQRRDMLGEGAYLHVVAAALQFQQQRNHGEEVTEGGRGVGEDRGHQGLRVKGSNISDRESATWSRPSPASRRSSFQV